MKVDWMLTKLIVGSRFQLGVLFAALLAVSGLASCGSGGSSSTTASTGTPPAVSISATSTSIAYNTSTDITWSSTDSTSCTSSGGGGIGTSGSFNTGALTITSAYTVTCVGAGGSASQNITITVAAAVVPSTIASVQAAWAAEPMRVGTVHYYCDCGTGASGSCVPGNDSNTGTSTSSPKQTLASAISTLNAAPSGDTVALCKGGAFNAAGQLNITATCTAGTTCKDLREYTPSTFSGTAKPIINKPVGGNQLFQIANGAGGVRILNISMNGNNGSTSNNYGFFFYNGAHDITVANVDMDGFNMAIYNESGGPAQNNKINIYGSRITNISTMGYLGMSNNSELSYNYWDGVGSDNVFDHAIYVAGPATGLVNFDIIGNYIHGQSSPTCLGTVLVGHPAVDGFNVKNNTISVDADKATPGCYGIGITNTTGNPNPVYLRNTVISGNTIINGGNNALAISSCPGCIIENNVIINNWSGSSAGISVSESAARAQDDISTAVVVRNNTVYYGSAVTGTTTGIRIQIEGTNHISSNNIVYSSQASGTLRCFQYPLALTSYAFINNNDCYSTGSFSWEVSNGSNLAAWQSYAAAYGFDSASLTSNPSFVAAPTDFTPATGSPLIGAGNNTYKSTFDITGKTRPAPPAIGAYEP